MQVLLIDFDQRSRNEWQSRIQALEANVTAVATVQEGLTASVDASFSLALCRLTDQSLEASAVSKLKSRSESLFCILDRSDAIAIQSAYSSGFDDCLCDRCTDEELKAKIDGARILSNIQQRLAQAQKLGAVGELASGIAHEINTPIQYVGDNTRFVQTACQDLLSVVELCQQLSGTLESAGDVAELTEKLRSALEEAEIEYLAEEVPSAIQQSLDGVQRVANIVRAMKEFVHPGAAEMTPTDLTNCIKNTAMVARNEWKYLAELEMVFDDDLPLVPCLAGEINQVLLIMIVNAAHAVAERNGESSIEKGKITITTSFAPPHAEIRISDTGSGITPQDMDRIFMPFFTTKSAGKGTGQGLAIAHSVIIEKHLGSIEVDSEVGRGTTFTIRIPLETSNRNVRGHDSLALTSSAEGQS